MDATLQAKLARLQNYATRYEVVLARGDERVLVMYTTKRSRSGLLDVLHQQGEAVVAVTGCDEVTEFKAWKGEGIRVGEWRVRFSGRTQRECYCEGEAPFVRDVADGKAPALTLSPTGRMSAEALAA